jgi:hypothetical protein
MDLKYLYDLTNSTNILEKYNLPHNFFTKPDKVLNEETCLNEIIYLLIHKSLQFPSNDTSDIDEFVKDKTVEDLLEPYSNIETISIKHVKTPYVKNTNNTFIKLICFMRAYASNTYTHKGNFKEYFKDVFNVFYNPL